MTDVCIHIANLFYLASFVGRDILFLRLLTVCGLLFGIVFFTTCQKDPMYGPTFWHVVFLVINVFWIVRLIRQRGWRLKAPEVQKGRLRPAPIRFSPRSFSVARMRRRMKGRRAVPDVDVDPSLR